MIMDIVKKLLDKTNVHGTQQITESSAHCSQITWIITVLALTGFSIFQIYGLVKTFAHGDTTFSNEIYDVSSWDDLSQHMRVMYCAPDWMNEKKMIEQNASALALLIALSEVIDYIHKETFHLLNDMLNDEDAELVSYEVVKDYAYGEFELIKINMTVNQSKYLLSEEMQLQEVSSSLDLIKKFTILASNTTEIAIRYGIVCQIMHTLDSTDYGPEVPTYFEVISALNKDVHGNMTERPNFVLLFEPNEIGVNGTHFFLDSFSFQTDFMKEDKSSEDYVATYFEIAISVSKASYLPKYKDCVERKHAIMKKGRLRHIINSICYFNASVDTSNIDNIESFLKSSHFPSSLTHFNDTTGSNLSPRNENFEDIKKCLEKHRLIQRSCEEIEVRIRPPIKQTIDSGSGNGSYSVRQRLFAIVIDSFMLNEQRRILTFDSLVGAVGGSLGVCLGASLVSIFQFGINCLLTCYRSMLVQRENDESKKASYIC